MNTVRWEWAGIEDLIRAMERAPETLRTDGMSVVRVHTEGAAAEIRRTYEAASTASGGTGTLAGRVQTSYPSSTLLVGIVRSMAPHAFLYDNGTEQRHTAKGWNRGIMPAHHVVPPIAVKWRQRMYDSLADLLRRTGLFEVPR